MPKKSVKPISTQKNSEPLEESLDFNNPDYSFIPEGRHTWRQQGPYLVCMSCEIQHATYIGMDKIMVGEKEDGTPIIEKR